MPAVHAPTFGDLMRRYRVAAGLTQEELAERAGLSVRAISNLERGTKHRPRKSTVDLLVDALGLEPAARAALESAVRAQEAHFLEETDVEFVGAVPIPLTPMVGRDGDLAALKEILRRGDTHLVTLVGPAGVGKTRLSLQAAAELRDDFPDGVRFVPLAAVRERALVLTSIAGALGVAETGRAPLETALKAALAGKRLLLVLDNFEQVAEAAPLLSDLLTVSPHLKLLVTSRAVLHVSGEQVYLVQPLSLPRLDSAASVEILSSYAATALFILRAQAARSDFRITAENAPAVVEICHRLDGLPLALELAAARSRSLPPRALLARLDRCLNLLTGGPRDLPSRQQSLRDALDWSYGLMTDPQQRLFTRLGVFAGGCSVEAVEGVCSADVNVDVLDTLESLVDQSLLCPAQALDERFIMLETIREYALERLEISAEAERVRERHALYYLALAETADAQLHGTRQADWLARLEEEHANLRGALRWAHERAQVEIGLRLAVALWRFWHIRGHLTEGRRWLDTMLAPVGGASAALRATALNGAGVLAQTQGDYDRAVSFHEESLDLRRRLGDSRGVAGALNNLGLIASSRGDYPHATTLMEESLAIGRELGDLDHIAMVLSNLGDLATRQGEYERAESFLAESQGLWQQLGTKRGLALVLCNRGNVATRRDDLGRAVELYRQSLLLCQELGHKVGIVECLEKLSWALAESAPQQAVLLWGAVELLREVIGEPLEPSERQMHNYRSAVARTLLTGADFARLWEEGRAMSLEDVIAHALGASGAP